MSTGLTSLEMEDKAVKYRICMRCKEVKAQTNFPWDSFECTDCEKFGSWAGTARTSSIKCTSFEAVGNGFANGIIINDYKDVPKASPPAPVLQEVTPAKPVPQISNDYKDVSKTSAPAPVPQEVTPRRQEVAPANPVHHHGDQPTDGHHQKPRRLSTPSWVSVPVTVDDDDDDDMVEPRSGQDEFLQQIPKFDLEPEFVDHIMKYIKKNTKTKKELQDVIELTAKTQLVGLPLRDLAKFSMLRNPILHIGLFDDIDYNVLLISLYDAAGRPAEALERVFDPQDRSTWSLSALQKQSMKELARLQIHAGPNYNCAIDMFLKILKLDEEATNNVVPFHENFFPVDKSSLLGNNGALKFRLLDCVFSSGTAFNTRRQMMELRSLLFPSSEVPESPQLSPRAQKGSSHSYEMTSSPLNAVTLPDAARAYAAIPMEACFFSYCYPMVSEAPLIEQIRNSKTQICMHDPFVKWMTVGAFIYFDFQFDVIGKNAVSFDEVEMDAKHTTSALCLGESSLLPLSAIRPLHDSGRWAPVTDPPLDKTFGFSHFAWVNPSEFIGDSIFPRSGGFCYLHKGDVTWEVKGEEVEAVLTGTQKSRFFPVTKGEIAVEHIRTTDDGQAVMVPKPDLLQDQHAVQIIRKLVQQRRANRCVPLLYNTPLHIDELAMEDDPNTSGADRFGLSSPEQAIFAAGASAAYGLPQVLGYSDESDLIHKVAQRLGLPSTEREKMIQMETETVTAEVINDMKSKGAVWMLKGETPESFAEELQRNMSYVLYEKAKQEAVLGNNGVIGCEKDTGHDGWTLADFHSQEPSKMAQLTPAEVASLRLYTSSTFRVINGPLRANFKPHPLAATTLFISNALKKLRACHMDKKNFRTIYLWRGMRDRTVTDDFMLKGGSELACMSTSSDLRVVATYARSKVPLLLRLKVDSPMELGADLRWLSIFPGEAEVLYPPLTFVKPLYKQVIKGSEGGLVVTIKPSFPS